MKSVSLVGARVQELRRGDEAEEEAGARGGEVEGDGTLGANGIGHHAGVSEHVVGGRGSHHHLRCAFLHYVAERYNIAS